MRNADRRYRWFIAFLATATIAYVSYLGVQWRQCSDDGGKYVRGLFTMECIDRAG